LGLPRLQGADERHTRIRREVEQNPLILDEELASLFSVSIHTIRSDRRKIGIPEVRRRGKEMSRALFASPKALAKQEIVGDILEMTLDKEGLSLLETGPAMGLKTPPIVRGHVLFAQANTLANAIVDAPIAVTASAIISFIAPVRVGERVLARAMVVSIRNKRREIDVVMKTNSSKEGQQPRGDGARLVFEGRFTIYGLSAALAERIHLFDEGELEKGGKK
jgi:acyl-coenzyme A thioesterase PaaI-like protein